MKRQRIYSRKPTPEEEEQMRKNLKENPLTKKDKLAMVLAALIVFIPAVLIVIGIFLAVIWFFFMR